MVDPVFSFSGPEEQHRRIQEANHTCQTQISSFEAAESDPWCPMVWDGLACWNSTPAGQTAVQFCPGYIAGFDQQANATRSCLPNGTWFWHPELNRTWTNYTNCYENDMATVVMSFPDTGNSYLLASAIPVLKTMSQVGYAVSLTSLLVASAVLALFKKLRCPRNMLHLHLFASFIMRAFFSLLKFGLFVDGLGLASDFSHKDGEKLFVARYENWVCKLIISLWQYFIMANYSWILMEGLYLHNLIFLALFSDTSAITLYVALGWGLPTVFVGSWVVARRLFEDTLCWNVNGNSNIFHLIRVPTAASILLNFGLFVNIIRMLMKKLQASICDETRRHRYRRWAKSTLVLVPLFGAHYAILMVLSYGSHTGVDSSDSPIVEIVWLFLDQACASFQGFFVAVLYCFMNGEVRTELSKIWGSRSSCFARRRGGFWFKARENRHPSLHSYDTCSSYGHHQAPWAIRKRSEGRSTVISTTACPGEACPCPGVCPTAIQDIRAEEVPLSLCNSGNESPWACSQL